MVTKYFSLLVFIESGAIFEANVCFVLFALDSKCNKCVEKPFSSYEFTPARAHTHRHEMPKENSVK